MTTDRERLVEQLVPLAAELVCLVRDEGADSIGRFLHRVPDLRAMCVVLAAMVPDDRPVTDLLAWVPDQVPVRELARHWTDEALRRHHSAFNCGRTDEVTRAGEQEYQRRRAARKRAAKRERGAA